VPVPRFINGQVFALAASCLLLAGCGGSTGEMFSPGASEQWFSKKLNLGEKTSGGSMGVVRDTDAPRPVTADDYVSADGSCALPASASAAPATEANAGSVAGDLASAPAALSPTGGGVALTMTECEVVTRLGRPQQLDIGSNVGDRAVTMTYLQGDRPGIYHFAGGRLKEIERGPEPEPVKQKPVKKKPKPKTASVQQK
jgi:hypothetical protein